MVKKQKYSLIHIENCQIKSLEKAKLLCFYLDKIEKEFGIKEVEISFKNNFICPDIDLSKLARSKNQMRKLVGKIWIRFDKIKFGKKSKYFKNGRL